MNNPLWTIINNQHQTLDGVYCACTASKPVIKTVLKKAKETNTIAVIEATANQVDHYGGYTGMLPIDFKNMVYELAKEVGVETSQIVLGGDHLGPLTFKHLSEEEAMKEAEVLVYEYVKAGFTKIHIDTSMKVASDDKDAPLVDEVIARRGARLLKICDDAYKEYQLENPIVYIIGSEVPIPGGAQEVEEMHVTSPEDFQKTIKAFETAMENHGVSHVYKDVIGVVVQPGVEFGDETVDRYNREAAKDLIASLSNVPGKCFEGHSSDYQSKYALKQMVEDGIRILKVGPGLTFAYREALFGLSMIEKLLISEDKQSRFIEVLDEAMLENPGKWQIYYHGTDLEIATKRAYSFSDRTRYYLPVQKVQDAIITLESNFDSKELPLNLLSQYFPVQYRKIVEGQLNNHYEAIIDDVVGIAIDDYLFAISK